MLITHIKYLVNIRETSQKLRGAALATLPVLENAYLQIEEGRIQAYGPMDQVPAYAGQVVEASGRALLPAWCDSHTHLVFAASREAEFVDKIRGLSYAAIAARGGGILRSAADIAAISEDALYERSLERLRAVVCSGTGAIEIKSGYGLSLAGELKMLRVIRRLKAASIIPVKASFLGAHAIPVAYKEDRAAYIRLIIEEMLPQIASEGLADYIDVFCEQGFFTRQETEILCEAGARRGLRAKIHANQLSNSGGVEAGLQAEALSVDHLEAIGEAECRLLGRPDAPIATLLPSAAFFLRMPQAPARALIDANAALALASDYNPGSSPSGNMQLVVALACIQSRLLPEEAINAATCNGAWAMGLEAELGTVTLGKKANLILTRPLPSLAYLPYSFGENLVERMIINGAFFRT
ncbi:imidazolonepropionase [Niabella terrae]